MATDNRTLAELMTELSRETSTLVRKEIELATTEISAKAAAAGRNVAIASAGGVLIHAGFLVFLAFLVIGLGQLGVTPWLATLLVAVLTIICGTVLLNAGVSKLRRTRYVPRHTVETLKESTKWTTRQGA